MTEIMCIIIYLEGFVKFDLLSFFFIKFRTNVRCVKSILSFPLMKTAGKRLVLDTDGFYKAIEHDTATNSI
jgi:hypothetical protein